MVRKGLLRKREDKKSIEEALEFARKVAKGVGLHEAMGDDGSFVWSRERSAVEGLNLIKSLDAESDDESGDDLFKDDEPDDD